MARVTTTDRSALSGKVEGLVYVHLNGQTFVRRAPRYKKESSTPGMLQNQQRFKEVNHFCAQFKDSVIPQIWNGADEKMSGYALFLKSNMAAFGPDGTLQDAKKLMLSTGMLSFPQGFEAKRSETDQNRVEVNWPKEMHVGGVHLKDELMAVCSFEGAYSDMINTGIVRNDLGGTFTLPYFSLPHAPHLPGDTSTGGQASPMLYLFFASANRRDYSGSACFEV